MKSRCYKKTISVILAVIMMMSVMAPLFSSYAAGCDVPIVYVQGQGWGVYDNCLTPEAERVYPFDIEDGYILSCVKDALPYLAKAVFLGQWDAYYDVLVGYVDNVFSEVVMDKNGDPRNNSGSDMVVDGRLYDYKLSNGSYGMDDYNFRYDWRLDPSVNADILEVYISNVLQTTGASQVKLVTRCEGTNLALAYLTKYGHGKIDSLVLYCGTMDGLSAVGSLFSGDVTLDSDNVTRYALQALGDDYIMSFIKDTIVMLNETYKLDIGLAAVQKLVLDKIIDNCFDELVMASYGTMPGYWSMVGDQYFNSAKTYLFGENCEENNTEYAGLIEKINDYHNNVQLKAKDMLKRYNAEGLEVYIIAKYGFQNIPVNEEASYPGDDFLEVTSPSYGASVTKLGTTFSDDQIKGSEKYASPDRLINASTCLFPDNTWFVNKLDHRLFPASMDEMMMALLNSDTQATVNDFEAYPQYLLYDEENDTVSPLTSENMDKPEKVNVFTAYINFLKSLFNFIKTYIAQSREAA